MLFELGGVDEALARSAMERAIQKLPMKAKFVVRPGIARHAGGDDLMTKIDEFVALGDEELLHRLADARKELFNLRFQFATGQLDSSARMSTVRTRHRPHAHGACASARSQPPRR